MSIVTLQLHTCSKKNISGPRYKTTHTSDPELSLKTFITKINVILVWANFFLNRYFKSYYILVLNICDTGLIWVNLI